MRMVTCAGCMNQFDIDATEKYRNKTWCGSAPCKSSIDIKVKHKNYKIKIKKINNGTYRSGVTQELRKEILERDRYTCHLCKDYHCDDDYSNMQVHHIIPVSEGRNDDHSNLITLCHPCHKRVHIEGWDRYARVFFKSIEDMVKKN